MWKRNLLRMIRNNLWSHLPLSLVFARFYITITECGSHSCLVSVLVGSFFFTIDYAYQITPTLWSVAYKHFPYVLLRWYGPCVLDKHVKTRKSKNKQNACRSQQITLTTFYHGWQSSRNVCWNSVAMSFISLRFQ